MLFVTQKYTLRGMDMVTEKLAELLRYSTPETLRNWLTGLDTDEELLTENEAQNAGSETGRRELMQCQTMK